MRLNKYLILESDDSGRTKEISRDEFIDLARKHCKVAVRNYLNGRCTINRGSNNSRDYMLGDARKSHVPRRSKNATNHYTLYMDNHPLWKSFPKRSLSFICSSGEYGSHFGRYNHVILPYDGVKIGVVKGEDIWDTDLTEEVAHDLQDLLTAVFQLVEDADAAFGYSDRNWNMLSWCIQAFDKMKYEGEPIYNAIVKEQIVTYNRFISKNYWKGSLEKTLEYLWSPESNDIWIGDTSDEINNNDECWMEGPVLMLTNTNNDWVVDFLRSI